MSDNVWRTNEMSDNVWPDRAGNFHPVRSSSDKFADGKNPTLKRLVLTSTVGAVLDITKEPAPGPVGDSYTADDWNPVTYEEGSRSDHPPFAYRAGKKFAELEAWAAVDPTSKHLRQLEL